MVELVDETEGVAPPAATNGAPPGAPPAPASAPAAADEWRTATDGRQYVPKLEGRGVIYRLEDETVAQARARHAQPRDKRPKRKSRAPKMPDAPRTVDLKELEHTLAEALKAPAMVCATFGDEWAAEHFTNSGPYLARNLILASEHNPWLRRKLEEAATGQDAMMMVVSLVGVGGALFSYVIPPVIYWFNLPAPPKTREMFGIPDRKPPQPAEAGPVYGFPTETPEPAPTAFGA